MIRPFAQLKDQEDVLMPLDDAEEMDETPKMPMLLLSSSSAVKFQHNNLHHNAEKKTKTGYTHVQNATGHVKHQRGG